jgi:hypothetical protein
MKGIAKPSIYFSAYPLKALEQATNSSAKSSESSPYLRSVIAGSSKKASQVRVFPMINPYKNPYKEVKEEVTKMTPIDRVMRRVR